MIRYFFVLIHFCFLIGRVNDRIPDRAEIRTPNFQLQYLFQLYSKNLTTVLVPGLAFLPAKSVFCHLLVLTGLNWQKVAENGENKMTHWLTLHAS